MSALDAEIKLKLNFAKITIGDLSMNWCPHTDSNREPTDYKSVVVGVSPQIIIDSK